MLLCLLRHEVRALHEDRLLINNASTSFFRVTRCVGGTGNEPMVQTQLGTIP